VLRRTLKPRLSYSRKAFWLMAMTCGIGMSPLLDAGGDRLGEAPGEALTPEAGMGAHGADLGEARRTHPFPGHGDQPATLLDSQIRTQRRRVPKEGPGTRGAGQRGHVVEVAAAQRDAIGCPVPNRPS
jgi:hypothetical protein